MANTKSAKERKEQKGRVELLLRIEGLDYDEWLDKMHQEVEDKNKSLTDSLVEKGLEQLLREKNNQNTNHDNL